MLLYVILDLKSKNWKQTENPNEVLKSFLKYLNTFKKSSYSNRIIVVSDLKVIFDTKYCELLDFHQILTMTDSTTEIVQDLGFTLCLINLEKTEESTIFILNLDNLDRTTIGLMKAADCAKKFKVKINSYSTLNSPILSQICSITGGVCFRALDFYVEILGFNDLGDSNENYKQIVGEVKCVCHKSIISFGYVCPTCLGIYCKIIPVCTICKSKIEFKIKR